MFLFVYWAMILSIAGMYTMYIAQLGFTKKEIGVLVTIYTIAGLFGQSLLGYLADKYRCIKKIMLISISIGIFVAIGLAFTKQHYQVSILIGIWGFFISGSIPLSDIWTIDMLRQYKEERNFGRIRGFGSIGYGLSSILLGFLLQRFGWKIYYSYIAIGVLITLFVIYFIEEKSNVNNNKVKINISFKEALSEIFKIKPLLVMILIVFMYNFVVRGIYCYLGVLVSDFGGGPLSLGFTYFFDASPEIITFFLTTKLLKKYDSKILITVSFLLQIVRLTVILIFNNALSVILMGILSGFAFGLMAPAYKTYIYKLSPEKYRASCISLSETIIGLSSIISAPIFGLMFTLFNTNVTIMFGLIIDIIVFIILIIYNLYLNKKEHCLKHTTN